MRPVASLALLLALSCLCFFSAGCNLNNPGETPPRANLYFPTALALSSSTATKAPRFLYVVNANYDLRYSDGSLQAYDLDELDSAIEKKCTKDPSIDCEIDSRDVLTDEVLIPPFTTGIALDPEHSRLYIAARTEASLLYVDLDENGNGKSRKVLACGPASSPRCDGAHKRGDDSVQNARRLRFPSEPVAVFAGKASDLAEPGETPIAGNFVLVAHRGGQTSLFLDEAEGEKTHGPLLTDVITGLPSEPTSIAFDPLTRRAYLTVFDRTSVTTSNKILSRVGVTIDSADPESSFLYDAGQINIDGISLARDTRSLAFLGGTSPLALVVSRQPAALLWVDIANMNDDVEPSTAAARRIVSVGAGPSRLTLGKLGTRNVVVVPCFDGRQIFVLDTNTSEVLSIVHNLSGPFEVALDSARMRLYVADFLSSVVRIVDLSPIVMSPVPGTTTARTIATLGSPKLIQELK